MLEEYDLLKDNNFEILGEPENHSTSFIKPLKQIDKIIKNYKCCDEDYGIYFFCSCRDKFDETVICRNCSETCHKDHVGKFMIRGRYVCSCGDRNHIITSEDEKMNECNTNQEKECFYEIFRPLMVSINPKKLESGKSLCDLCIQLGCEAALINQNINNEKNINLNENPVDLKNDKCECKRHESLNLGSLIIEMYGISEKVFIHNLNANIFLESEKIKQQFYQLVGKNIKAILEENDISQKENLKKNLDENFLQTGYLILIVDKLNKNSYFHWNNIFKDFVTNNTKLLELISSSNINLKKNFKNFNESFSANKSVRKNYLFQIFFHVFIKSHFKSNNNLLNSKSITNLNIFQRYIYLHQAEEFFKFEAIFNREFKKGLFANFQGKKDLYDSFIAEFINCLFLELENISVQTSQIDKMVNDKDYFNIINKKIVSFVKMFKFFIKYNLINNREIKENFFKVISEISYKYSLFIQNTLEENFRNHFVNINNKTGRFSNKSFKEIKESINLDDKVDFEKKKENYSGIIKNLSYSFLMMKCIYYFILYENDEAFIYNLKLLKQGKKTFKDFGFSSSSLQSVSTAFIYTLYIYYESVYTGLGRQDPQKYRKKKLLKMDFYIKNILESFIGNNNSYLKSFDSFIDNFNKTLDLVLMKNDFEFQEESDIRCFITSELGKLINKNAYNKNSNDFSDEKLEFLLAKDTKDYNNLLIRFNNKHKTNISFMENFIAFRRKFEELNQNFYFYKIDYFKYIEEINDLFNNLIEFIQTLNIANNSKPNKNTDYQYRRKSENAFNLELHHIKEKDIKLDDCDISINNIFINLQTSAKYKIFKVLIEFTDFFYKLNEFLDIYSKRLYFKEPIGENLLRIKNAKFILKFLADYAYNNIDGLALIFSLRPKNLVNSFHDEVENLCLILKSVSKTMINNDYFANYIWLFKFIKCLLRQIEIQSRNLIKNDILLMTNILKYFGPILSKANNDNPEIIDILELILEKFQAIKDNKDILRRLKFHLFSESQLKNINDKSKKAFEKPVNDISNIDIITERDNLRVELSEINESSILINDISNNVFVETSEVKSLATDKKEEQIWTNFLISYFKILNIIYEKKLNYFNCFNFKNHVLFSLTLTIEKLFYAKNLDFKLRTEVERYLHNFNLSSNYKLENIDEKFSNYCFEMFSNKTSKKRLHNDLGYESMLRKFNFSFNLLKKQIRSFMINTNFEEILQQTKIENNNKSDNKSLSDIVKIFAYFEICIFNPLYKLLHLNQMEKNSLDGESYFKIYEIIYNFMDLLKMIYNKVPDDLSMQINKNDSVKKIKAFDNISIKFTLNKAEKYFLDINYEKIGYLRHFQFAALLDLFRAIVLNIRKTNALKNVYLKNKIYNERNFEKEFIKCYEIPTHQKVLTDKFISILKDLETKYLNENQKMVIHILKDYRGKVISLKKDEFIFLKSLNTKSEFYWEFETLLKYLFTKFFENLTHLNYKEKAMGNKFQFDVEKPIKKQDEVNNDLSHRNKVDSEKNENNSLKNIEEKKFIDDNNIESNYKNINNEINTVNKLHPEAAYLHLQDKENDSSNIDDKSCNLKIPNEKFLDIMENEDEESYIFIEDSNNINFDDDSQDNSFENEENKNNTTNKFILEPKDKGTIINDDDYKTIKFKEKYSNSLKISNDINKGNEIIKEGEDKDQIEEEKKSVEQKDEKNEINDEKVKKEEEGNDYEDYRFDDYFTYNYIDPKNLNIQNFHYLKIITYLFTYYSEDVQDAFEKILIVKDINFELDKLKDSEVLEEKYKFRRFNNLANYIIRYIIYGFFNLEILKTSEISTNNLVNFYDLIYENLMSSIYIFQAFLLGSHKRFHEFLFPFKIIAEKKIKEDEPKSIIINTSTSNIKEKPKLNNSMFKKNMNNWKTTISVEFTSIFFQILIDIMKNMYFDHEKEIKFSFLKFRNDINLINFHTRISRVFYEMSKGCYIYQLAHFFENVSLESIPQILKDSTCRNIMKLPFGRLLFKTINCLNENDHMNNEQDLLVMMNNILIFLEYLFNKGSFKKNYIDFIYFCLDEKSLIQIMIKSIIKLVLRYQYGISYENPMFYYYIKNFDFLRIKSYTLLDQYISNQELCKDQNFLMASHIYFLLKVSADQHKIEFCEKIFEELEFLKKQTNKDARLDEGYIKMSRNKNFSIEEFKKLNIFEHDNKRIFLLNNNYERLKKVFYIEYLINYKYIENFGTNLNPNFNMETNNMNNLDLKDSSFQDLKITNKLLDNFGNDNQNKINYGISYLEIKKFVEFLNCSGLNLSSLTNYNMMKENFLNRKILIEKNGFLKSMDFLNKIYKSVEINPHDYICKEYFQIRPLFLQINKTNRQNLIMDFERSNPERKIDSLYKAIDYFILELDYKRLNFNKRSFWNNIEKKLFDIDYKYIDLASFAISVVIQIYLFSSLDLGNIYTETESDEQNKKEYHVVFSLGICQLVLNFIFFLFYIFSKYKFNYIVSFNNLWKNEYSYFEKNEINKEKIIEKLSYYKRIKLRVFDSLILNQEIFFVIFNLIIGFCAIWDFRYFFAYTLQLFTVIRYIKSIQDFFRALKFRGFQLLATVFFLFMVTSFFANIGMYFMKNETDGRGIGHVN